MDNVFTFFEVVEWARQCHQPLEILLLDFEKAYEWVDGDFLEGTMSRMGFLARWISGVFVLYRSASNAVTIAGYVGSPLILSKSVR